MIIRKQALVKLVELADQAYTDDPLITGHGRPYVYTQRVMFKCFVIKICPTLIECCLMTLVLMILNCLIDAETRAAC